VEELAELSARFREIEVTLDEPPGPLPAVLPAAWLNAGQAGTVVRFVDTRHDAGRWREEIASVFGGVREVEAREMGLRAIFLALARSKRRSCN
jgi:hypothetical protein